MNTRSFLIIIIIINIIMRFSKPLKLNCLYFVIFQLMRPIPVAEQSKARVYGRSLARIEGSNPTGGIDVCLF